MTTEREKGRRRWRDERGAALVEFALIFPIFMTIVLGMFSGGTAYDQKSAMTNAAREGARYAATLPLADFDTSADWLHAVADYVENASEGNLGSGVAGWEVCVAYVHKPTTSSETKLERHFGTGGSSLNDGKCYPDNRPEDEYRVQVTTKRDGKIQALFFEMDLNLNSRAVARFEAFPS